MPDNKPADKAPDNKPAYKAPSSLAERFHAKRDEFVAYCESLKGEGAEIGNLDRVRRMTVSETAKAEKPAAAVDSKLMMKG